jgi:four helix bundle protein
MGSLAELETQLLIAQNLGYISSFELDSFNEIRKMLNGLIYKLK